MPSSKYRGVTWNSVLGKWRARIQMKHNNKHLGHFDSEQEAARAWDRAATAAGRPAAQLNFPAAPDAAGGLGRLRQEGDGRAAPVQGRTSGSGRRRRVTAGRTAARPYATAHPYFRGVYPTAGGAWCIRVTAGGRKRRSMPERVRPGTAACAFYELT